MSVFIAGTLQRQMHAAKGTYFDSAIDSPMIFNRANLPRAGVDFVISGGLVRNRAALPSNPGTGGYGAGLGKALP